MPDQVTEINFKSDLSGFARAHEDTPITWEAQAGPGGTIIIVEHYD